MLGALFYSSKSPHYSHILQMNKQRHAEGRCLVAQSCLTLCDPMDCSPPGSCVHGISQTKILEWVAMPSFRGSSQPGNQARVSCIAGGFFTS